MALSLPLLIFLILYYFQNFCYLFSFKDLVALSAEPLLCYPTHYTGEANYISDTEESDVIPDKHVVPGEPGGTGAAAAAPQHKTAKSMYAEASRDVRAAAGGKEEL